MKIHDMWEVYKKKLSKYLSQWALLWYHSVFISFDRIFCEELAFGLAQHFRKREKLIKGQNNWKDLKLCIKRVQKAEKKFKRLRDGEAESTKEER